MENTTQKNDEEILTFNLCVITPERKVFDGEVLQASMTGVSGEFDIQPRHEPFLTPLKVGEVIFSLPSSDGVDSEEIVLAVHGGFLDMDGTTATVYASSAEKAGEIDIERAKEAEKRARERLEQVTLHQGDEAPVDFDRAQLALLRAVLRIQIVEHYINNRN